MVRLFAYGAAAQPSPNTDEQRVADVCVRQRRQREPEDNYRGGHSMDPWCWRDFLRERAEMEIEREFLTRRRIRLAILINALPACPGRFEQCGRQRRQAVSRRN